MIVRFILAFLLSLTAQASPLGPDGVPGQFHSGRFVWFELATENPAAAQEFYGAVFGWKFRAVEGAPTPYAFIENAGGGKVGGMFQRARPAGAPVGSRWLSLLSVRDAEAAARLVRGQGGEVILPPKNIPGRGVHALFRDPQGALFGVLTSIDGDPADDPVADGDVFWVDLFSPDPAKASAFYAALAGYAVTEEPVAEGRKRWVLATEGIARAGIVNAKAGHGWMPYILVPDVRAAIERARRAGGKAVVVPRPSLLDNQLAVIADPAGGVIGIVNWVSVAGVGGTLR